MQNPRSNAGNRVGYPGALLASDRVALGTDGYPADMAVEAAALEVEAQVHGDDPGAAGARLEAGWRLVKERFGPVEDAVEWVDGRARSVSVGGREVVRDGALTTGDIGAIRAEARGAAEQLWARMRAL